MADPPLYDITRPVRSGMPVWPGDAPCRVAWTSRMADGDAANVAELRMSAHTGTHADGPFHLCAEGARIGAAPLEAFIGPALLVDAQGRAALDEEWAHEVLAMRPERLLVRTGAWSDPDVFPTVFATPTEGAARMLVEAGVRLLGTDGPSVDPFDSATLPVHRVLCAAGVAILENLLLDDVTSGAWELVALPLRLEEADASPVRAVLRGP
ncbi:MAG TPA: cyclase family protein [Longimicrobium sp.]|jgi:arylformamidase